MARSRFAGTTIGARPSSARTINFVGSVAGGTSVNADLPTPAGLAGCNTVRPARRCRRKHPVWSRPRRNRRGRSPLLGSGIYLQARKHDLEPAGTIRVDQTVEQASVDEFDALVRPGGTVNPDQLRLDTSAVAFVRDFVNSGKPVAAICHGPWTLVEAGVVSGRTLTSSKKISSQVAHPMTFRHSVPASPINSST